MARLLDIGQPEPLGATWTSQGINFAVYAQHAQRLHLVLVDDGGTQRSFPLDPGRHRSQSVWHLEIPAAEVGEARFYAYRAEGPAQGPHRYDPYKLLVDPYAQRLWFPPEHRRDDARYTGATAASPLGRLPPRKPTPFDWGAAPRPRYRPEQRVIYELHVRGFTQRDPAVRPEHRGTYLGLIDKIPYLVALGVTTVELMPVMQFDPDEDNYWGYMTVGFFAPHAGYGMTDDPATELKTAIRALHEAGIEVLLDVVYNHSTEEDEHGPTYSFRGLDNATYYLLEPDGRTYRDDAGTGNVLNASHPQVRRLILDSLRYWATEFQVDGFRYDLATLLTRDAAGNVDPLAPLPTAIEHDPVLQPLVHIAEPWDLSSYQVGTDFPGVTWSQWNDRFRDTVRRFVKSDPGLAGDLITRLAGSPDLFPRALPYARLATQSINFVVAHDGFSLHDLVSYDHKHNEANGHGGHDGADVNHSWNCGFEGDVGAPLDVLTLRARQRKNLLVLLLLANGVPMLYMGDEFANTQRGNNNPYNQDNGTSWLDWSRRTTYSDLHRFATKLIAFRRRHPVLCQPLGWQDSVRWYGVGPQPDVGPESRSLAFALHGAQRRDCDLYVMVNAYWEPLAFEVQEDRRGGWHRVIDTMNASPTDIYDDADAPPVPSRSVRVAPRSVVVLRSAAG